MKNLLLLAVLATSIATAAAQTPRSTGKSGSAATRASSTNADSPAPTAISVTPNYSTSNQRTGKKTNTAPATGATRASRSSSGPKTPGQKKPSGSSNIESMSKKEAPGPKK